MHLHQRVGALARLDRLLKPAELEMLRGGKLDDARAPFGDFSFEHASDDDNVLGGAPRLFFTHTETAGAFVQQRIRGQADDGRDRHDREHASQRAEMSELRAHLQP